jgi:NLR family CARD domain-containing protein 3
LRKFPKEQYSKQELWKNFYPTTIHVLMSAIQKLARVTKLPSGLRLYRGIGGDAKLPQQFYEANKHGICGINENAFMSTTSEKSVAIQYTGIAKGLPLPLVFEISVGAVDRGANIQDFSQYPHEVLCITIAL